MDFFCEKYNEKISGEHVRCSHPKEYCKFRNACIIHFMGGENNISDTEKLSKEDNTMPTLEFEKGGGV